MWYIRFDSSPSTRDCRVELRGGSLEISRRPGWGTGWCPRQLLHR
jgi:hypothetical protein